MLTACLAAFPLIAATLSLSSIVQTFYLLPAIDAFSLD